jgi:DNA-binding NarL/FixJ family response regulator
VRSRCEKCGQEIRPWWARADHGLSGRQWEYVGLFCEGLRRKEIAERLCVCMSSVMFQVTAIGKVWGVKGMRQIAVKAGELVNER